MSSPVEEQEVLVRQEPCSAGGSPLVADGYRKLTKFAAALAFSAVVGSAIAFTHKASIPASAPDSLQPAALWEADGKVPCGYGKKCSCEWASAAQCGRRDDPGTPCWSCCCSRLFPEAYQWAVSATRDFDDGWRQNGGGYHHQGGGYHQWPEHGEGGRGEYDEFHRGQEVNVQSARGNWHPATILNRISADRFQVQYDLSQRVEIVRSDQMMDAMWTPWWVWLFWLCVIGCVGLCVAGLFGYAKDRKRRGGFFAMPGQ